MTQFHSSQVSQDPWLESFSVFSFQFWDFCPSYSRDSFDSWFTIFVSLEQSLS
jgi:hypothetical protein